MSRLTVSYKTREAAKKFPLLQMKIKKIIDDSI